MACSAYGCNNNKGSGDGTLSFFKYPMYDKQRLNIWKRAVGRKDWHPTCFSVLCSEHFTDDCFLELPGESKLRWDAVPSIFPDQSQSRTFKEKGIAEGHSNKSLDELYFTSQAGPSTRRNYNALQVISQYQHDKRSKKLQKISRMPSERRKGLPPERRKKRMPPPPTKNFFFDDQDLDSEESYTSDLQSQDDTVDNSPMAIELIHTDVRDFIFKLVYDGKRDMAVISSLVQMFSERELFQLDKSQRRFYPDKQTISMVVSQAKSKMEKTDEDNDTTNLEVCNSNTDDVSVREIQVINLTDQDKDHTDGENDMNNSCMEEILSDHEEAEPELSESKEPLLHKCEAKLQSIQSAMVFLDKQDLIKLSKRLNNVCKTLCNQVTIDNYSTSALELSFPTE